MAKHTIYGISGSRAIRSLWAIEDIGSEDEHAATVSELSARLLTWMQEVDDPLLEGPLRTPYYDRALADLLTTDTPRAEAGV